MGKKRAGGVRVKQVGPKAPPVMPSMDDLAIPPEEMVHLPPTPDRSYKIVWPIHESFSMKTDDFRVIYPSYLDANKTVKQGRRLAKEKAVPNPTVSDMSLALQNMQIRHVIQPNKGFSRDPETLWDNPGRVLVDTSNYSKGDLMKEMAQRIPDLPARKTRLEQEAAEAKKEEEERKKRLSQKASLATASKSNASNNKKKGKKGRKK